jgi:hypothetical protein
VLFDTEDFGAIHAVVRAQPVRDTVADLDFINWTIGFRHGPLA